MRPHGSRPGCAGGRGLLLPLPSPGPSGWGLLAAALVCMWARWSSSCRSPDGGDAAESREGRSGGAGLEPDQAVALGLGLSVGTHTAPGCSSPGAGDCRGNITRSTSPERAPPYRDPSESPLREPPQRQPPQREPPWYPLSFPQPLPSLLFGVALVPKLGTHVSGRGRLLMSATATPGPEGSGCSARGEGRARRSRGTAGWTWSRGLLLGQEGGARA